MELKIALAGNPNCGKTTLFNALTGANQYVGNWPGVTVEKKEGKYRKKEGISIIDLPGIYSLSPYTLEEVIARNYLVQERPDVVLNLVDGANLERNLYLTTQLVELGLPVVVAINMIDVVRKRGDKINLNTLSKELGCRVVEISALKSEGIFDAVDACVEAAGKVAVPQHTFSGAVEHAIAHIEEAALHDLPQEQQRWYALKVFERDEKVVPELKLSQETLNHIEQDIKAAEAEMDDDAESIITNERYEYIAKVIKGALKKKNKDKLTVSDKIDRVVTNRWAALPIFAVVMWIVYYVSVTTIGTWVTDWTNDCLFGDGFNLFNIGKSEFEDDLQAYAEENLWTSDFVATIDGAAEAGVIGAGDLQAAIADGDFGGFDENFGSFAPALDEHGFPVSEHYDAVMEGAPTPDAYGVWVPGIPVLVGKGLEALHTPEWLNSLLLDGVVAGVGAVLGFVPQMIVLFIFLALLEGCGYMARVAFVLDRIFRKFGLSGKSFIPMLVGVGCGVPGVMASRTIENERDRRMTIMTTTFIPCGAKLPIIALIATSLFGGAAWVGPSAFFIGIAAIIISGICLKKTKMFAGEVAPFVMELPEYHLPRFGTVFHSVWERAWSFIKRAGTIILISSIVIWAGSVFGWTDGHFGFNTELELNDALLGKIGNGVKWIFAPLGFGDDPTATIATVMGLVAKEEVVAVFGVLDFEGMTKLAAYSFLVFNLLCAPCFAAIGAIKREMNNPKWTAFAVGYQCVFAYACSLMIYQFGLLFTGSVVGFGGWVAVLAAVAVLAGMLYFLFRPAKQYLAD